MNKGLFKTETFNPGKFIIEMNDWVEPTLYNTGETTVHINGIAIPPKASFALGPANVRMTGNIVINFLEDNPNKQEVKVNYVLIASCQNPPQ